jgi:hypothetical protein
MIPATLLLSTGVPAKVIQVKIISVRGAFREYAGRNL